MEGVEFLDDFITSHPFHSSNLCCGQPRQSESIRIEERVGAGRYGQEGLSERTTTDVKIGTFPARVKTVLGYRSATGLTGCKFTGHV